MIPSHYIKPAVALGFFVLLAGADYWWEHRPEPAEKDTAGEALVAKGDLDHGIAELENARDRDPLNSKMHWDLLRAYTAAGQKDKADREKQEIEKLAGANSGSDRAQD